MKNIKRALSVALAALVLVAISAVPAQAWPSDCLANRQYTCVWEGQAYSGTFKPITNTEHIPNHCYNFSAVMNNTVESMANESTLFLLRIFTNTGCTGNYAQVGPGQWLATTGINNQASSFILYNY